MIGGVNTPGGPPPTGLSQVPLPPQQQQLQQRLQMLGQQQQVNKSQLLFFENHVN